MSVVTNVVLSVDNDEMDAIDLLNRWIVWNLVPNPLQEVWQCWKGRKSFEAAVFIGAFNYLPIHDFVNVVFKLDWKSLTSVQLMTKTEEERFVIYQFNDYHNEVCEKCGMSVIEENMTLCDCHDRYRVVWTHGGEKWKVLKLCKGI